ncbi:hypothetical protein [Thalassospira sp. CH_XMU1448-2]|uniref:hypothetical protein n=1 Tax=Thalassospira sp. CH_XMU1448-2 TaxID=3107773 RepID=UPI00300BAC1C
MRGIGQSSNTAFVLDKAIPSPKLDLRFDEGPSLSLSKNPLRQQRVFLLSEFLKNLGK